MPEPAMDAPAIEAVSMPAPAAGVEEPAYEPAPEPTQFEASMAAADQVEASVDDMFADIALRHHAMTATATATAAPSAADAVRTGSLELARLLGQLERPDLVGRVTAAAARLQRPSTIVAVVGEFKQGKSSLVNGLLGQPVCPVDDDLATSAITLVRYGEQPGAVVRRKAATATSGGPIPIDELHDWVTERGNPGNHKGVERVEITVPSAMLAQGLVLVDTPGMGGLGAGHAAATLAFLPFADGLILVSDASSELSAPGDRLPATRRRAVPDRDVRPDEDRPLPVVGADRRPQPRPPRAGRDPHPDRRRVEPSPQRSRSPARTARSTRPAGSPSWSRISATRS